MAYKVERLPGEPILLTELFDSITIDEVYALWSECARLVSNEKGVIYRITDARKLKLNFGNLVGILASAATTRRPGGPGISGDIQVREIVVAPKGSLARFGADSLGGQSQYGRLDIQGYDDLDQALAAVREQIKA